MEIFHRIAANMHDDLAERLKVLGFKPAVHGDDRFGLPAIFLISESHPAWPKVRVVIEKHSGFHMVETRFAEDERAQARYLEMMPAWHWGYPQPEGDFGYLSVTYDDSCHCPHCNAGKRQKAPFRMSREPQWGGKRNILQLNWVFDEYFVKPGIWEKVFKPFGIACRPVVRHRDGRELKGVVQLDISETADAPLKLKGYEREDCPVKGHKRYHPVTRGFFPPFRSPQKAPLLKSREHFGSGASSWRAVLVSAVLYRAMQRHKVRGVAFAPMAPVRDKAPP